MNNIPQVIKWEQHPHLEMALWLKYYAPGGIPLVDLVFYMPDGRCILWEGGTAIVRAIKRSEVRNRISRNIR